jgi:hypothetical protein
MNLKNSKKPDDSLELEPFCILEPQLKHEEQMFLRQKIALQNFLNAWIKITSIPIESIGSLRTTVKDPAKCYMDWIAKRDQEKTERIKAMLGDDYSFQRFQEAAIEFPEFFHEVIRLSRLVEVRWEMFALEEGNIELSTLFYTKQIGKSIHYAITPLQKKRLAHARKTVDLCNEKIELFKQEGEEAEMSDARVQRYVDALDFLHPIPLGVKIDISYNGKFTIKTIVVDEQYVSYGHRSITGHYFTRPSNRESGQQVRVAKETQKDGSTRAKLICADSVSTQSAKTKVLPGLFLIENGRVSPLSPHDNQSFEDDIQNEVNKLLSN